MATLKDINFNITKTFGKIIESLELLTSDNIYNYMTYLLADKNGVSNKVAKYLGDTKVDLIENEEYGYCLLIKVTNRVMDKFRIENVTMATITDKERVENTKVLFIRKVL